MPNLMFDDDRFAPSPTTLNGDNADVYFLRTKHILEAEGVNPRVSMEVFTRKTAVLAGMNEVLALLARVLPPDAEVWALEEGTVIELLFTGKTMNAFR